MRSRLSLKELEEGLKQGNRVVLSKAITLIESSLLEDQIIARELMERVMPLTGNSIRIGITGVPGAGKSTLIEALGKRFTASGKKVAVLAVDPSSQLSGGSILGDKTRMEELSRDPNAFIRPSPARHDSGGITGKTREAIFLCEAAGYSIVMVETVGVGQVETKVKEMVDFFMLIMLTGAGDELQMIKKGIMELADLIVINKADGKNRDSAELLKIETEHNLPYARHPQSEWEIRTLTASALEERGIVEIQKAVLDFIQLTQNNNFFKENRKRQAKDWIRESIEQLWKEKFYNSTPVKNALKELEIEVSEGKMPAINAALKLLEIFKSQS